MEKAVWGLSAVAGQSPYLSRVQVSSSHAHISTVTVQSRPAKKKKGEIKIKHITKYYYRDYYQHRLNHFNHLNMSPIT